MLRLVPLFLLSVFAQADLYDPESKLEQRYGPPVAAEGKKRTYQFKGYVIDVVISKEQWGIYSGQVIEQTVRRADNAAMTTTEIEKLLPTKQNGGEWSFAGHDTWHMDASYSKVLASATYSRIDGVLRLSRR